MPINNHVYTGYDENDQHGRNNMIQNIPNNITANTIKNSGNPNGISADDESSDSDYEYFVYKKYKIGIHRIKIPII